VKLELHKYVAYFTRNCKVSGTARTESMANIRCCWNVLWRI